MKKLFVVDASGYLYSSYFAIRNMTNAKGESTNALFGFIRSLQKLIKDFDVQDIVSVFDGVNNTKKRKALYADYKAHRLKMPEDLFYQIERAQQCCTWMGIPWLSIPEVEADDTMGSISVWAAQHDMHVYLCSGDKDLCQLVTPKVSLLNTLKGNVVIDAKAVEEIHGVPPHLMIDYLALVGDASDNIPGLPGFGPKTAAKLLAQFGSLDALLAHPEKITEAKKRLIVEQQKEMALLSRELVTIDTAVPIPTDLTFFQKSAPDMPQLREFYQEMNFKSLLKEFEQIQPQKQSVDATVEYLTVDDESSLAALLELLAQQKEICIDTETTGLDPLTA